MGDTGVSWLVSQQESRSPARGDRRLAGRPTESPASTPRGKAPVGPWSPTLALCPSPSPQLCGPVTSGLHQRLG